MKQQVRFCTAADGVRLAYAVHGNGFPLVRVATWLSHLELEWGSPVWRHWLKRLAERHTVIRYDERGCGLSDANIGDPSVDVWAGDLETVIDAVGLERFALLGVSQAAAIAVAYAARHPDRVSGLVLYGGYARGRRFRGQGEEEDAFVAAIQKVIDSSGHRSTASARMRSSRGLRALRATTSTPRPAVPQDPGTSRRDQAEKHLAQSPLGGLDRCPGEPLP